MENKIRCKQRFQNFEKSFLFLKEGMAVSSPAKLEQSGIIHTYSITFELAWKTLKDYLNSEGINVKFPRDSIKEAFQAELLNDGDMWMEMLEKRNLMEHIYDFEQSKTVLDLIRHKYFTQLEMLYILLKEKLHD